MADQRSVLFGPSTVFGPSCRAQLVWQLHSWPFWKNSFAHIPFSNSKKGTAFHFSRSPFYLLQVGLADFVAVVSRFPSRPRSFPWHGTRPCTQDSNLGRNWWKAPRHASPLSKSRRRRLNIETTSLAGKRQVEAVGGHKSKSATKQRRVLIVRKTRLVGSELKKRYPWDS